MAAHPQGADWASFAWRVSIAEIASGGPFSSFAGIDRRLVVLDGGMVLRGIGDDAIAMRPYDCVAFAGEAQVTSELADGPTRDFNVMTRRGVAAAEVRVLRDAVHAFDGAAACICHAAARACACIVEGTTIDVPAGHTLVVESRRVEVDASGDAVAVVATVTQ